MNHLSLVLRLLLILALFASGCLSKAPQNETSPDLKSPFKSISNLIYQSYNAIDSVLPANNATSSEPETDHPLQTSNKKSIDSKLIDEPPNEVDVAEKLTMTCNETEYLCKNDDRCIDRTLLCDGFKDCPLLEDDEANCDHNCTQRNKFECRSDGKCIDMALKCNGFENCADGSDENDCPVPLPSNCSEEEFKCSPGECIHKYKVCDHSKDCDDGSDELFCKYTCSENEFQCKKDHKCIPKILRCNWQKECLDGSDEEDCIHRIPNYNCGENEFSCQMKPKKCIRLEDVCDGFDQCGNGMDEPNECDMDLCKNHHCAHECQQERNIAKCVCKLGFKLSANGVDCEDINECLQIPSFCSGHECINQNGSATCNCSTGFRYNENENRCKVINGRNATIVYSNQNELRNISLSIKSYLAIQLQSPNEPSIHNVIRQNLHAIGMFVYDFQDNYLVWHDMNERRFYIAAFDENKRPIERNEFWTAFKLPHPHHQHYVLMENITNVEGLSIDYVHDLIYWSDSYNKVIEVAQVRNTTKRKVLVDKDLDWPKGIALNVEEGFVLWTDFGNKKIEYMRTDGTGRRTIYDKDLEGPYSISLDPQLNKIYFVDTMKNTLNEVGLKGQNHRVLLTNAMYLDKANDLDVFEDKIYFCNQESETVLSVDKFNPKSTLRVLVKDLKNVLSCRVVHYSKQSSTAANLCEQSDCEFLCLPRNDLKSHVCACDSFSTLNSDKRNCQLKNLKKDSPKKKEDVWIFYILALATFAILAFSAICLVYILPRVLTQNNLNGEIQLNNFETNLVVSLETRL